MKKVICIFVSFLAALSVSAQNKIPTGKGIENKLYQYTCDSLKEDDVTGIITFMGNVTFRTKNLELKAGKVEFTKSRSYIKAYRVSLFNFDGAVSIDPAPEALNILEHTIGEGKVYLK